MKPFFLTLFVVVLGVSAAAQAPPSSPAAAPGATSTQAPAANEKYPLREILIVGNDNFASEDIIKILGLELGQMVQQSDFQNAVSKLDDTGVFEGYEFRFGPKGDGYTVTFTVREVSELYSVRFEGFKTPDDQIRARLRAEIPLFGPRVPPTGIMAKRIGDTLQDIWIEEGNETAIVGDINFLGEDELEMLYKPEGVIQNVAYTQFENAKVIQPLVLQQKFNSVAMGVTYSEQRIEELLKYNVRPLYEAVGRLDVKFCPCTAEPDSDTKGLVVTVHVEEGEEYKFGEITPPETSFIKPEDLGKLIKFAPGDMANLSLVTEALKRYEEQFKANGFMNVRSEYNAAPNADKKIVDIAMRVAPGDRYLFGKLEIEGLDIIAEGTIRKRWGLKPGEPFNQNYPAIFLNRIRADNMFDNLQTTDWRMKTDEAAKTVDVHLVFK